MRLTFFLEGIFNSIATSSSGDVLRRMGGAVEFGKYARYPSRIRAPMMGIAKALHPSYFAVILNAVKNLLFRGMTKNRFFGKKPSE
jgi:hypothetical protein